MIDESFHITSLDVRRFDFGRAFRGCDPEKVEQFREQVAEELDRLGRVNADLDTKARSFHEQLRAFRERDKALNEALVSAQQLRAETREQASVEAQLLLKEAQAEGDRIIEGAKAKSAEWKRSSMHSTAHAARISRRCARCSRDSSRKWRRRKPVPVPSRLKRAGALKPSESRRCCSGFEHD